MGEWVESIFNQIPEKEYKFLERIDDYRQINLYTSKLANSIENKLGTCNDDDITHTNETMIEIRNWIKNNSAMRWFVVSGFKDAHEKYYKKEQPYEDLFTNINDDMLDKIKLKYKYRPGKLDLNNVQLVAVYLNRLLELKESQRPKDKMVFDTKVRDLLMIGLVLKGNDTNIKDQYIKLLQNFIAKYPNYNKVYNVGNMAYHILFGYDFTYTPKLGEWFSKLEAKEVPVNFLDEVPKFIAENGAELKSASEKEGTVNQNYMDGMLIRVKDDQDIGESFKEIIYEGVRKVFNSNINFVKAEESPQDQNPPYLNEESDGNGYTMMCNLHKKLMFKVNKIINENNICIHCLSSDHNYAECNKKKDTEAGIGAFMIENYGPENNVNTSYYEKLSTANDKTPFVTRFDPNFASFRKRKYEN